MTFKKNTFLFLFILFIYSLNAQEKTNPNHKSDSTVTQTIVKHNTKPMFQKNWKFGGNIGLGFSNNGTDILIAPKAYYEISPQFMAGAGLTYIYSQNNNNNNGYSANSIGGSILGIFRPIHFLQLSVEFEELHTSVNWKQYPSDSFWNEALYLGFSYVSGNFAIGIQYDVLYNNRTSLYGSAFTPIVSFYF